jgi:hypothetical protein
MKQFSMFAGLAAAGGLNSFEQRLGNSVELTRAHERDTKLHDHLNVNVKIGFYITAAIGTLDFMMLNLSPGQTPQNSVAVATPGETALGFDQGKAVRHFKLLPDGGVIEMTSQDPVNVGAVRRQIANIVTMFGQGKFDVPAVTHGRNSPGADRMRQLKGTISYVAENLPDGGRVRITTTNSEARNAVHDFLRFQIREHQTGDSLAEPGPAKRQHPANNLGHDARPAQP